ncbi:MAG: ComF family protein [Clostridia bacterium]|nr:ComF family protein [Clostridia bacterium]
MFNWILNTLFPERCVYCRKEGKIICKDCLEKISHRYLFQKVYDDWFDYVFCGSFYKGVMRAKIHSFKFHQRAYLYKYFIEACLYSPKMKKFLKGYDLIAYVPMHYKKEQKRGYNQAKLLAEELGRKLDIPVMECLEKKVENKTQSSLSEAERSKNVEKVYSFKNDRDIQGKNMILVDDILTTGATIRACSKILKQNGAGKVCAFAIAKTES